MKENTEISTDKQHLPKLGHVHLKVKDIRKMVAFYMDILGLKISEQVSNNFVFLTFGAAHHDLALQSLSPDAEGPRENQVGLYHTAFELSSSSALLEAVNKLEALKFEFALVDHGISWALYTADPDGNGVELYVDRRGVTRGLQEWSGRSRRLSISEISQDAPNR